MSRIRGQLQRDTEEGFDTRHDWDTEALRDGLQAYPPYAGAGVLITHIAEDASEVHVEMPLTAENANAVGTHFGGSL